MPSSTEALLTSKLLEQDVTVRSPAMHYQIGGGTGGQTSSSRANEIPMEGIRNTDFNSAIPCVKQMVRLKNVIENDNGFHRENGHMFINNDNWGL